MLGTYTLKCWTHTPPHEAMPFKAGETAEFELREDNSLTVRYNGQCITLTNPFRLSETDQRTFFRDNCVFNVLFVVQRTGQGGGSYDQKLRSIAIYEISGANYSGVGVIGSFQF